MLKIFSTLLLLQVPLHSAPAWKTQLSPHRPGPHPPLTTTTLDYRLSWKGMLTAGKLRMEFAPRDAHKPGSFVVRSSASSLGAAGRIHPYSHSFWSETHPRSLTAKFFQATETDKKDHQTTIVRYGNLQTQVAETTKNLRSGVSKNTNITFPHGNAHDLFSAMLYIRSQKLDVGDRINLLVMPFKTPYLAQIHVQAKEKHQGRDTIRLQLSMRKIDRHTGELAEYKKLKRPATLWLSDDTQRILLELRAAAFIGDVRAVLTSQTTP